MLAWLYVIGWIGYGVFSLIEMPTKLPAVVALLLWGFVMFSMSLTARWINRRLRKKVLDNEFRVGIDCAYCLRHLPAKHRCPECGAEYDVIELEHKWVAWYPEKNSSMKT